MEQKKGGARSEGFFSRGGVGQTQRAALEHETSRAQAALWTALLPSAAELEALDAAVPLCSRAATTERLDAKHWPFAARNRRVKPATTGFSCLRARVGVVVVGANTACGESSSTNVLLGSA